MVLSLWTHTCNAFGSLDGKRMWSEASGLKTILSVASSSGLGENNQIWTHNDISRGRPCWFRANIQMRPQFLQLATAKYPIFQKKVPIIYRGRIVTNKCHITHTLWYMPQFLGTILDASLEENYICTKHHLFTSQSKPVFPTTCLQAICFFTSYSRLHFVFQLKQIR